MRESNLILSLDVEYIEDTLKTHLDWSRYITKRFHKFLFSFIDNDYLLKEVASSFRYDFRDMQSIFLRIQRECKKLNELKQRELMEIKEKERELKQKELILAKIKERELKLRESLKAKEKEKELKQKEKELKQKELMKNAFKELNDVQKKLLISLLNGSKEIHDLTSVFPPRLVDIISSLNKTMDIDQTCREINMNKEHLINRIFGRKKPRKPCEHGAFYYLNKEKEQSICS